MSFVKLHGTILDSSIWSEPSDTRIVWITMLAMANQHGIVEASVSGVARRAAVSVEATKEAIGRFLGPDPDSRDGTTGERIEIVPGGWLILNHANYRERQTDAQVAAAERSKRHRERRRASQDTTHRDASRSVTPVTPASHLSPSEAEAEADTEAEAEKKNPPTPRKRGKRAAPAPFDWAARLQEAGLDLPEVRTACEAYLEARRSAHGTWTNQGMKIALRKFQNATPAVVVQAFERATEKPWATLFPDNPAPNRPRPITPSKPANAKAYLYVGTPEWKKAHGYE